MLMEWNEIVGSSFAGHLLYPNRVSRPRHPIVPILWWPTTNWRREFTEPSGLSSSWSVLFWSWFFLFIAGTSKLSCTREPSRTTPASRLNTFSCGSSTSFVFGKHLFDPHQRVSVILPLSFLGSPKVKTGQWTASTSTRTCEPTRDSSSICIHDRSCLYERIPKLLESMGVKRDGTAKLKGPRYGDPCRERADSPWPSSIPQCILRGDGSPSIHRYRPHICSWSWTSYSRLTFPAKSSIPFANPYRVPSIESRLASYGDLFSLFPFSFGLS